jgi:hypothetical protein
MNKNKKNLALVILAFTVVIAINLLQSIRLIKFGNFNFHTDIARDFFLIKNIVDHNRPSLIGPRVGEIGGLFHGPAWIYLNLPVFLLSNGNPVAQNYFCLFLVILSEISLFFIAKKIFGLKTALVATLLYALKMGDWIGNYFHPFGAIIFSPVFYYFFYQASQKKSKKNFFLWGLTAGLLAHFQLGFGLPMVILSFLSATIGLIKKKNPLANFASFLLGLFVSLANFIVFDFRHNFLQTKSIIIFLKEIGTKETPLLPLIQNRLKSIIYAALALPVSFWSLFLLLIFLATVIYLAKNNKQKRAYQKYLFIFAGFWLVSLINTGGLQGYHYWGLLPLSIIVIASLSRLFPKFSLLLIVFYLTLNSNLLVGNFSLISQKKEANLSYDSWQFISRAAQSVFADNQEEFGYFAYTSDLYSYPPRYAMEYWNRFHQNRACQFEKKPLTYLLIFPPPADKPWLEASWWTKNQVNIDKKPERVLNFDNGFRLEKYSLSPKEINIPADPNLIQSSHFR